MRLSKIQFAANTRPSQDANYIPGTDMPELFKRLQAVTRITGIGDTFHRMQENASDPTLQLFNQFENSTNLQTTTSKTGELKVDGLIGPIPREPVEEIIRHIAGPLMQNGFISDADQLNYVVTDPRRYRDNQRNLFRKLKGGPFLDQFEVGIIVKPSPNKTPENAFMAGREALRFTTLITPSMPGLPELDDHTNRAFTIINRWAISPRLSQKGEPHRPGFILSSEGLYSGPPKQMLLRRISGQAQKLLPGCLKGAPGMLLAHKIDTPVRKSPFLPRDEQ